MSSFQAVATSIAAQVGTGNITGCATAMISGGPGAIFWMWVAAFLRHGHHLRRGLPGAEVQDHRRDRPCDRRPGVLHPAGFKGTFGKILAGFFALAIIFALGFTGNMVQSNAISNAFREALNVPPGSWA